MDNSKIELIGAPCGTHGPYTFYKAFKYSKSGRQNILALNEFVFIKLWSDSDIVSIGELQQLWVDKNSDQTLASLRLYILPENTPEGRTDVHGEHEVLALQERVVIRCEDLLTWIADDAAWYRGLPGVWEQNCPGTANAFRRQSGLADTCLDFKDVDDEKEKLDPSTWEQGAGVVILSFPRYCRYRSVMKRLEGVHNKWLRNSLVTALGGFAVRCRDTRVLFCKDTFDYPDLEGHELLCNHLAPKINLRPRRKRKKQSTSPGESESNESESSLSTISSSAKSNKVQKSRNGLQYDLSQTNRRIPTHTNNKVQSQEERSFLDRLHRFMNSRQTPIMKIPSIGFKELDLYTFFSKVQRLGGYEGVTNNRMWKSVFDELGGDQSSTSAATCSRRHYERLLLPYERKLRADAMRRRLQTKCRVKAEDDTNDGSASRAGSNNIALPGSSDRRDVCERRRKIVLEGMTSSLRSVRLKTDKSCDGAGSSTPRDKENIPLSNAFRAGGSRDIDSIDVRSTMSPEVIVLDAESETPIKTTTTPIVPALKKRKLDMLKEGGLEVTPIAAPGALASVAAGVTVSVSTVSVSSAAAASESRNSAPKAASPESPQGQVSIMVTPDLSHMLGTSKDSSPDTSPSIADSYIAQQRTVINVQDLKQPGFLQMYANRSRNNGQTPPRVIQSRSMYSHSETTVYGNPKECISTGQRSQPPRQATPPIRVPVKPSGAEVLDLRMKGSEKPAVEIVRVPAIPGAPAPRGAPIRDANRPKPPQVLPVSMGRATVGDNLEITLVENPKLALAKLQQEQRNVLLQQRRVAQQQAKSVVPTSRPTTSSRENGRHPSSSVAVSPTSSSRNRASPANSGPNSTGLVIPSPYLGGATVGAAGVGSAAVGSAAGSSSKRRNSNDARSRARVGSGPSASGVAAASQFLPGAPTSIFPLLQQLPSAASAMSGNSTPKNPPFLPLLDTMYYQAICNSQGLYASNMAAAASYMNSLQMSNPQLFAPSAEQLQLYKELMAQHSRVKPNSQGGEDFARLVQDGSTSITLVGNSKTPTSK